MTARIIGIVSGKGGVGKTVTAVNLATALHQLGQNPTIVDADITASNLGLQLGVYSFQTTLQDVLRGNAEIHQSIYSHPIGLKIIPSSISLDYIDADLSKLGYALNGLDGTVIVDSPPGLGRESLAVLEACNEILIVSSPEIQTMANALKVARTASEMEKNILGLVINRYCGDKHELNTSEIKTMCENPILSKIPEDRNVKRSLFEKMPVISYSPYSPASIEFKKLACRLTNQEYEQPQNQSMKMFFERLKTIWR